ncbi:MAG: ankyrin repeat domain-containing protein [Candidatus Margulisiibacteriota bacterium]
MSESHEHYEAIDNPQKWLAKAQERLELGDYATAYKRFMSCLFGFRKKIDLLPSLEFREGLAQAWTGIVASYPIPFYFSKLVPNQKDWGKRHNNAMFVQIKTFLFDHLLDGDWRIQYEGRFGAEKSVVKTWKQAYFENEAQLNQCKTPLEKLLWAVKKGHGALIHYILASRDTAILQGESAEESPVYLACYYNHPDYLPLLVDRSFPVNVQGQGGWTPLHWMVYYGNTEMVSFLLEKGADPNVADNQGFTALHWAIYRGSLKIFLLLLNSGSDPLRKEREGVGPFHMAVSQGRFEMVQILGENKEVLTQKDYYGWTPLHVAVIFGHFKSVEWLLGTGVELNVLDVFGRTPLHWAAQTENDEIAELLVHRGAQLNVGDQFGDTPLHLVGLRGHSRLASFLYAQGAK